MTLAHMHTQEMKDALPVMEIFGPTIQGEGRMAGHVSHFIRLGGCGYRCAWCDSMHAVDPARVAQNARWMSPHDIHLEIRGLPRAPWVTLTGGDPLMYFGEQPNLIHLLCNDGYEVAVETQGQFWRDWLRWVRQVTVSPKPPSSDMSDKLSDVILSRYVSELSLHESLIFKVVVFNTADLDWAEALHRRYPEVPFYLSAGTPQAKKEGRPLLQAQYDVVNSFGWLATEVLKRPKLFNCVVGMQQHALIWGDELGR